MQIYFLINPLIKLEYRGTKKSGDSNIPLQWIVISILYLHRTYQNTTFRKRAKCPVFVVKGHILLRTTTGF